MGIVLGGKNERFHRVHGDIVASYAYVNGERAMILYPNLRRSGVVPVVICDSSAWKYNDEVYLAEQARLFARLLGYSDSHWNWYRIAKIIHEGLGDLVLLKPEPVQGGGREAKRPIGVATLKADGVVIAEGEVEDVSQNELDHYERGH